MDRDPPIHNFGKDQSHQLICLKASLWARYFFWFPSTSTILETIALKVVAFNGSARKDGNTAVLLKRVLSVLETEGFETELIQLRVSKSANASLVASASNPRMNAAP
jgi:hypothetical protein